MELGSRGLEEFVFLGGGVWEALSCKFLNGERSLGGDPKEKGEELGDGA